MEMLIIFIVAIVASLFFGLISKNKEKSFYKDESNKENDRYIAKNTDTTRGKSKRFLKIKLSDDFFLSEQEKQGLKGEKEVAFYLDRIASHFGGYVFDSFIFKDEDDYSSEIDHTHCYKETPFKFLSESQAQFQPLSSSAQIVQSASCLIWDQFLSTFRSATNVLPASSAQRGLSLHRPGDLYVKFGYFSFCVDLSHNFDEIIAADM